MQTALAPHAVPLGAVVVPQAQSPLALQLSPAPHVLPHAPQCVVVSSARSQPFARVPSQSPKPAAQAAYPQVPIVQVRPVAFCTVELQLMPHEPHAVSVLEVAVSQPLERLLSQSPKPPSQLE